MSGPIENSAGFGLEFGCNVVIGDVVIFVVWRDFVVGCDAGVDLGGLSWCLMLLNEK